MLDQGAARGHAVAPCHCLGREVVVPDDGADLLKAQSIKSVVPAGLSGLCGIALVPGGTFQQVAYLGHLPTIPHGLPGDAALAHHLTGCLLHHRPQPKAVPAIARLLVVQPVPGLLVRKGVLIGVHHRRVLEHPAQQAAGGAGPDMGAGAGPDMGAGASNGSAPYGDDVVDGDYKEV